MCLTIVICANKFNGPSNGPVISKILVLISLKTKMRNIFFNLSGIPQFEEQVFQCELAEALGLVRKCFICDHYSRQSIRLADCDNQCECRQFTTRNQLISHYCDKILNEIDSRLGSGQMVFISSLGMTKDRDGTTIYAHYLLPLDSTFRTVLLEPTQVHHLFDYFEDDGKTRLSYL